MSAQLGRAVTVAVSRRDRTNPAERMKQDCTDLAQNRRITSEIDIPDAASSVKVTCDFQRRALEASMWLKAPPDKKQVRAHRTWVRNQLAKSEDPHLRVVAYWPGRTPASTETLVELRSEESKLVPDDSMNMPTSFEVLRLLDLGDRLSQTTRFPDVCSEFVRTFYEDVGQHLRPYHPQAPKIPASDTTGPAPSAENVIVQIDGSDDRIGEPPPKAS